MAKKKKTTPTTGATLEEAAASFFAENPPDTPCSVPGCDDFASDPPHRQEGKPICPKHASARAGGRCVGCGSRFDPAFGAYDCYPNSAGDAVCIDCWTEEGLTP